MVKAEDDIFNKRSTFKPALTSSIHIYQQLECIILVHWTSDGIASLTTFKVTRFSSSFNIPACESISTWTTLKIYRKVDIDRSYLWSCFFMLFLQLWHYLACKTFRHQHTPWLSQNQLNQKPLILIFILNIQC